MKNTARITRTLVFALGALLWADLARGVEEFYEEVDSCRALFGVVQTKGAKPHPGAVALVQTRGKETLVPVKAYFHTGDTAVSRTSPLATRVLGQVVIGTKPMALSHLGDEAALQGLLFEAGEAIKDEHGGSAPRGVAHRFVGDEAKQFLDEVRSQMQKVEGRASKALHLVKGSYLKPTDLPDRHKLAPMELGFSGFVGGVGGALLGGALSGDPISGAKLGAMAGLGIRVGLAKTGLVPIGDKFSSTFLKPEYNFTQMDLAVRQQKYHAGLLLHDPETGMRSLVHWDNGAKALDVYHWYPKISQRRMDWTREHKIAGEKPDEEVVEQEKVAEHKPDVAAPPVEPPKVKTYDEVMDEARKVLVGYVNPHYTNGEAAALQKAKPLEDLFDELPKEFIERDDLIDATRLIVLADGHLLMLGPPGTGKTRFATGLGNAFLDEHGNPRFFTHPATAETSYGDLYGGVNHVEYSTTGRKKRFYDEGFLGNYYGFVDEVFNAPIRVLNYLLTGLSDKKHEKYTGILKTMFAASNKYLPELFDKYGDDEVRPMLDRWGAVVYVPNGFSSVRNKFKLYLRGKDPVLPKVKVNDLKELQAHIDEVRVPESLKGAMEILFNRMKRDTEKTEAAAVKKFREAAAHGEVAELPYRSFRTYSNRTGRSDFRMLQTAAVDRALRSGGKDTLVANLGDLHRLKINYTITGLSKKALEKRLQVVNSPSEKAQLKSMKTDRDFFEQHLADIFKGIAENSYVQKVAALEARVKVEGSTLAIADQLVQMVKQLKEIEEKGVALDKDPADLNEDDVGEMYALERAQHLLHELVK